MTSPVPDFGPALRLLPPSAVPMPIGTKRVLAKATMNDAGQWVYEDRELWREGDGWHERALSRQKQEPKP